MVKRVDIWLRKSGIS